MDVAEKVTVLSKSSLFDMLADAELGWIADRALARQLRAGELVFEQGELGDSVYVIASGEVAVEHQDEQGAQRTLAELGPAEFFGEMSLIDKVYRSATVRTRAQTQLLQLSTEDLSEFRGRFPAGYSLVVLNIARALAGRLREANEKLGPLLPKASL